MSRMKNLLKKAVVCVMTAALCAGVYVPMTAEAYWSSGRVSTAFLAGDWECYLGEKVEEGDTSYTSFNIYGGVWSFYEDGTLKDNAGGAKKVHIEDVDFDVYEEGEVGTLSGSFWAADTDVESIDAAKDSGVYQFMVHTDEQMTYYKLQWNGERQWTWGENNTETGCWELVESGRCFRGTGHKRSASSSSKKSHKSAAEKEAEEEARRKEEEEKRLLEEASREAVRLEGEAAEQGFVNGAQMQDAKAAGKSSAEYYNNAVVATPGIENAVPVAQGGQLVIDGKTTNATATIEKVTSAYVDSIRAAREGTLLNVVQVSYPATEAVITFYMPSVQAGDGIVAAQYVDGAWTDVEVTQVRADHVTLNMKGNGVVAFLKK